MIRSYAFDKGVLTVVMHGAINQSQVSGDLPVINKELAENSAKALLLDIDEIEFIDDVGLRTLLDLDLKLSGALVLTRPRPNIVGIFKKTNTDQHLKIIPDPKKALAELTR